MTHTPLKPYDQEVVIEKINELYIQTRRKYLMQTPSQYITFDRNKSEKVWTLNDGMLKLHLDGINTYGIFNGNAVNKFITFDVDFSDAGQARWATLKLIDVLQSDFNISREDIHVSVSGGKGYHVDLYFDKPITLEETRKFYTSVLSEVGDIGNGEIEFRPSFTQGVKLPLGIHQVTGARCWFVDKDTLEPIKSFEYLNDVEPMNADIILDSIIELTAEQEAEFERVVQSTDVTVNVVDAEKATKKALKVLSDGQLTTSNSRHATTLLLASFFNSQGYEEQDAIDCIMSILLDTPIDYFSKGSTPEHWLKEAERIVRIAFKRNYTLGNADRPITIYKSEIIAVLQVGTFRQKQVAYAMLSTSKRYGEVFYLTRKTLQKMIGIKSNETIQSAIAKLVEVGFIEYTRRAELDKARTRELGQVRHKPNKYRLLIDKPVKGEKSVEVTNEQTIIDVAYLLCEVDEIRSRIGRKEYSNRWERKQA